MKYRKNVNSRLIETWEIERDEEPKGIAEKNSEIMRASDIKKEEQETEHRTEVIVIAVCKLGVQRLRW